MHTTPTARKRAPWWCYALLLAAVCSVASAGVAFKWIGDVPPITLASWRLQITTVITAVAGLIQWQSMSAEHKSRFFSDYKWTLYSGFCLAVHFGTWVWSLEHTSLAHSLLLVSTTPVILVVFALVMRHAISVGEIMGAVFAVVGVAVLAGGAVSGKEAEVTIAGDLSAIAAAVTVALHWHAGKYLRTYQPVFVYSAPVTAVAAGLLMLTAFAAEEHTIIGENRHGIFGWTRSARYAPFVIYLGAVPGIIGHQGFNTVLKYMDPLMVSLAVQFEPIVGPIIGWAVGVALPPGLFTWIGGLIVLLAAAGATVATARRERQEEQLHKHKSMRLPTQELEGYKPDVDTMDDIADTDESVRLQQGQDAGVIGVMQPQTVHDRSLEMQLRSAAESHHQNKAVDLRLHMAKADEYPDYSSRLDLTVTSDQPVDMNVAASNYSGEQQARTDSLKCMTDDRSRVSGDMQSRQLEIPASRLMTSTAAGHLPASELHHRSSHV